MTHKLFLAIFILLAFNGCSEDQKHETTQKASEMKCGAGKCGANMFNKNSALAKKKKNILSQMREDDTRKKCVLDATTTKELYNCVRDPQTQKLSLKCGTQKREKELPMKCGASKCGNSSK